MIRRRPRPRSNRFRRRFHVCLMRATYPSRILPRCRRRSPGAQAGAQAGGRARGRVKGRIEAGVEVRSRRRPAREPMSPAEPRVDLSEYAAAVPQEVVDRLRAGRRVLTICHENPEADALGSALAIALLVEAGGGVATPVCADPMPAMYTFLPGMDRFRREPAADLDYDLLVVGDCGELERIGPVLESHRALFESRADTRHRPPRVQPPFRRLRLGRSSQLGDLRDGDAAGLADGHSAHGSGRDARLGTGCGRRHGHRQLPAPQHDAAHAGRGGGPARGGRATQRDRPPDLSHQAQQPARSLRPRAGASRVRLRRPARLVHARAGRSGRRRSGRGRVRGSRRHACPGPRRRRRHSLQGGRRGDAHQRPNARWRGRDGADRHVRWGRARSGRRGHRIVSRRRRRAVRSWPEQSSW